MKNTTPLSTLLRQKSIKYYVTLLFLGSNISEPLSGTVIDHAVEKFWRQLEIL